MIKIQISDIDTFKSDYLLKIKEDIVKRITNLNYAVSHLRDPDHINDNERSSAKHSTKHIIDLIRDKVIDIKDLKVAEYKNTLLNYKNGGEVMDTDLEPLSVFLDYLLDDTNDSLKDLLICAPEDLFTNNTKLLDDFNINEEIYIKILKHAFLYDSDIGGKVRQFFHEKNITEFCPYCNISRAFYSVNPVTGKIADQHQLDHFFDKATYPLLSLSLFNLVPSDSVCNTANKHEIHFSDELHLNPYISGFKNDMKFEPLMDEFGKEVLGIDIKLKIDRNSLRWKQLIGDQDEIHLAPKHGNINVFQIHTKYNAKSIYAQTSGLIQMFRDLATNEKSIRDILNSIQEDEQDNYENFKSWYEKYARGRFHQKNFGELEHSKLYRDLLDFVFENYPQNFHESVNDILTNSYLPECGGE
ncbi:hypothetical protein JOE44_000360 [Chryseobacterium sp. PvR013]|uniref:hypothetical protein n=1 Tax=Chryseobacterium sp. PvR013 TaxID=2806595 RepID=UPI001AE7C98E|nr:hypothetical protein [Chryseobacterium sp. PvR013]MBP1163476.1 hypothetical protein [Chryseobacterium sp. PvR013]